MKELLGNYKLVLGLEIHLHLRTETKMFCSDDANIYDAEPNTHVCPVCLGLPGALPVPNYDAVKKTQLLGLATNCSLNKNSRFDRKHYFYPDLAKGYQISQYKQPFCENGYLTLGSGVKADIERIHLEEDTAKSMHVGHKTLIDFNKAGMPLVEIVTRPTFDNVADAVDFSHKIQEIVRYLDIGDADMEKGQMRLEANISLRTKEMEDAGELPKYKVEIKNINSFKFMERAVLAEVKRQRELLESGKQPIQENRGYDENKNITVPQREKEEAHDYRYFPEPDIPPMEFDEKHFEVLRKAIPELPHERIQRLQDEAGINKKQAEFLANSSNLHIYETYCQVIKMEIEPRTAANALINRKDLWGLGAGDVVNTIKEEGNKVSDQAMLEEIIDKVLADNPDVSEKIRAGNVATIEFVIGQVMRETRGKADSGVVRGIIESKFS